MPAVGRAFGDLPGPGAVDRLAVDRQPGAEGPQADQLAVLDAAVGPRSDVEQHVAVLADDVDEEADQLSIGMKLPSSSAWL